MENGEKLRLSTDQRPFILVYKDFFQDKRLDCYDKMVFIALKYYADNRKLTAFPSIKTLQGLTGISERKIRYSIKHMEELGVLQVQRRVDAYGVYQSNFYTLFDWAETWIPPDKSKTQAEMEEEMMIRYLRSRGYSIEKGLAPADQSTETSPPPENNYTVRPSKKQPAKNKFSNFSEREYGDDFYAALERASYSKQNRGF